MDQFSTSGLEVERGWWVFGEGVTQNLYAEDFSKEHLRVLIDLQRAVTSLHKTTEDVPTLDALFLAEKCDQ